MESKRRHPSGDDNDVGPNDRSADLREKKMKMPYPSHNVNDEGRPAARSTTSSAETDRAGLDSCEVSGQHSSDDDDVNNNCPPAGSGLALLNAYEWLDVASCLDHYENAALRFASGALNRLIHSKSSTLPRRVIASLIVGQKEYEDGRKLCWAKASKADFRTNWPDLVFLYNASPESRLLDVLGRCKGFVVAVLELRDLPYNERVMDVMAQCLPFVTVSVVFVNGVASGHDQVPRLLEIVPGLREVTFKNDAAHPNAAAVLSVGVARRIPVVTLLYAVDVTEAQILDFLFNNSSATTTMKLCIVNLGRPISDNFFGMIVEKSRGNKCKALRFAIAGILTDLTDAKHERFVVERDDNAAMYKFDAVGQTDLPFTIVVGKTGRFCLKLFQGQAHGLCSSLAAAKKEITCWI